MRRERTDAVNEALEGLPRRRTGACWSRRCRRSRAWRSSSGTGVHDARVVRRSRMTPAPRIWRAWRASARAGRRRHLRRPLGPQLPALLRRPGDLADRHLDADDRAVVAGAELTHSGTALGGRRAADAAGAAARPVRRRDRRPRRQAQADDRAADRRWACRRWCSALLTVTGVVQVWEIGILAALLGLNNASRTRRGSRSCSSWSARSICATRSRLNSVLVNVARAIGPAVAGILIAPVGDGVCFLPTRPASSRSWCRCRRWTSPQLSPDRSRPQAGPRSAARGPALRRARPSSPSR